MPITSKVSIYDIKVKATNIEDSEFFIKNILSVDDNGEINFKSKIPVVLDFYADWCGPCKGLSPIMDELADEYKGRVGFYKIDIDKADQIAISFGVMSIPTLIFFPNKKDNKPIRIPGAISKTETKKIIEEHLLKKDDNNKSK
tara:strand:+ start:288 stop:716 length:429 start_codon:yes stop_codon:yes gene_type:complete